ncbi:DNA replication origin-binding helicase [Canid alphaherpesvirus 1]|nr:DNA replication origin-binding helicase [Canid alphaherpesvirus 1]QQL08427.1 DNA replication origin-binding helicase [Canid alphaherpesvirus 1]WHU31621.1 DNA replication origin-binding helicase [Canid alphaherpesvirus 1]WHU31695.1 DNA replication origin-binding helicase [Canid alphaherpesvirus 1]
MATTVEESSSNTNYYTSSVSLARMLYGGDIGCWIETNKPKISVEYQFDQPVSFLSPRKTSSRRITIVKAPMGSGKTTALLKWLEEALEDTDKSVLVISCRRSFTHSLAGRFNDVKLNGFITYFASTNYIMMGEPFKRLFIQIESLHRVDENLLNDYDILVLDEVMSTLSQLYSPTMKKLNQVDALLLRLLKTCPNIIAMDATINTQLVDFLATLRGEKNIHVIVNNYTTHGFSKRNALILRTLGVDVLTSGLGFIQNSDGKLVLNSDTISNRFKNINKFDSFFGNLYLRLVNGLNVCIFSSTVIFSEIVAKFCLQFTDNVLVLNSSRPIENVKSWNSVRVLIYTTVVTVGISFDSKYFHAMFAYIKPMNHGPDMVSVYQSLGRIRELIQNELFIYMDSSGARSEAIFTPMLLNHVVNTNGGWPSNFTQVTNLLCCKFKSNCKPTFNFFKNLTLFSKFKYKHFFERCTLASIGDSINILHILLELNRINVNFDGCDKFLTADIFCQFIKDLRLDANYNQRVIKQIKVLDPVSIIKFNLICENDDVLTFINKYLLANITPEYLKILLKKLSSPIIRTQFINLSILGACLRVPESLKSIDVFTGVYNHYTSGVIPAINDTGVLDIIPINPNPDVNILWSLFKKCAFLTKELKWNTRDNEKVYDISPETILLLLKSEYHSYLQLLLEVAKCNITPVNILSQKPVLEVSRLLKGDSIKNLSFIDHAVAVFKLLWEDLFGVKLTKSKQTFPGVSKVKNLRKNEIIDLLNSINIDHSNCKTHKQLYTLLMCNKNLFTGIRYKLRAPKWSRFICFLDTKEGFVCESALNEALSSIPSEVWPQTIGALNFNSL